MSTYTHDQIEELLGAYALDAVDVEEAAAVQDHLRTCPRCRAEVEAHREVASLLVGGAGGDAPADVWDRIAADLGDTPPPQPIDLDAALRRRRPTGLLVALAAAVVVVLALLGGLVVQQRSDLRDLRASVADDQPFQVVTLQGGDDLAVPAVVDASGEGVLLASTLPALPADRTYQLWGTGAGDPVSLGVLGDDPDAATFEVEGGYEGLAITEEPPGGSVAPTSDPVATGALA